MKECDPRRADSTLESQCAEELRAIVSGVEVGAEFSVEPSADFCSSLELLVPQWLAQRFPEWKDESLDGVFVSRAGRTGAKAIRIAGACILISDQTLTPLLIELELGPGGDSIAAYRVGIGEPGGGRLGISGPPCNTPEANPFLATVSARMKDIRWVYEISSDAE